MSVGRLIYEKRSRLGMTQKELSDVMGLGKNGDRTIRRWESGDSKPSEIELKYILQYPETPPFRISEQFQVKFTMIDLFAGIGGIRLGFQELGGKTLFTSEWDKFAQKTYRSNFGDEPKGDITKITNEEIPVHDILLAGFPCQPFSQAGLKQGFEDTRGTLFFDIARIIDAKRPKAFLLENVKQLKGHNRGKTMDKIIDVLVNELGYYVSVKVLRAADFGVPQNRERVYIVGFNNRDYDIPLEFEFPIPPKTKTRVGNILESNKPDHYFDSYTISDKLYKGHLRRKEMHKEKGNGFGFSEFTAESEYTNTISARYYKDGSEILIKQDGRNPRKLTPRECARLQGFSDQFLIPVSDSQAYRQFGNSVAVPVIRAIAEKIVQYMEKNKLIEKKEKELLFR